MHFIFVSHFWNFFLTSGAHTRKRTIASLRWIGSLLRGEMVHGANARIGSSGKRGHRASFKKRFQKGRPLQRPPFLFCPARKEHRHSCPCGFLDFNESDRPVIIETAQARVPVLLSPRRKRWPRRPAPARDRWIHSRNTCRQSPASRGILPREYPPQLPEFPRALSSAVFRRAWRLPADRSAGNAT